MVASIIGRRVKVSGRGIAAEEYFACMLEKRRKFLTMQKLYLSNRSSVFQYVFNSSIEFARAFQTL